MQSLIILLFPLRRGPSAAPRPILVCLALPSLRTITITALSDAFFQVSVFVAATLFIYYYAIDHLPQLELRYLNAKSPVLEVSFAAFLGMLPGCGGAIIVVTQFTKGQASFGAIVAVLTATMGDAAFLLLATRPTDGLTIMAIGLVVGTLTGLLVNKLHKTGYLCPTNQNKIEAMTAQINQTIPAGYQLKNITRQADVVEDAVFGFNQRYCT